MNYLDCMEPKICVQPTHDIKAFRPFQETVFLQEHIPITQVQRPEVLNRNIPNTTHHENHEKYALGHWSGTSNTETHDHR
jgi:hypothetical protein